jgi:phosphohistidine phosphatase
MDLILWRHAEAEDSVPDSERKLTAKGRKQAERVAAWLAQRLPDDARILASPTARTQQTAASIERPFDTVAAVGPGASCEAILEAAGWPGRSGTVVVVGHQPVLGEVASRLLAGKASSWGIKKGALWWFSCREHSAGTETTLRAVVSPDLI